MSPEEFERLKEAEKAHLRKLKELKEAVRAQQRTARIAGAVGDIAEGRRTSLEATGDAVDRLARETAQAEARLDLALDARRADADAAANDEELERLRARDLIRHMKAELAGNAPAGNAPRTGRPEAPAAPDEAAPDRATPSADDRPGAAAPFDEGLPEKTIGRMRRD